MSLQETKIGLREEAAKLGRRYEDYSIDELANEYCAALDSNDENKKNIYISALLLRFWYTIDKMYQKVKTCGYEREDVFFKLYQCIDAACQYRAWQDPAKNTNAQACINQIISTRGVPAMVGESHYYKNTPLLTILDDPISEDGETTFGDQVESDDQIFDGSKDIVQSLIKNNNIVEAIIADTIAHNNSFKTESKTVKIVDEMGEYNYIDTTSEFWPFKVVQALNKIDDRYINYFTSTYTINGVKAKLAFDDLMKATNQKKYKMISKALETAKLIIGVN